MPRIDFDVANKQSSFAEFEKLKLDLGETARVSLVGQVDKVQMEWVHTLRKPEIVQGRVMTEKMKRRNSDVYEERLKYEFVSRVRCTGDPDVLRERGADPDNCPVCAAAAEHAGWFDRPQRRFAINVLKYHTRKDGQLHDLYHGMMLVWAFTDRIYGKLVDMKNEGADFDKMDLILGPCEAPVHFQKFDILLSNKQAEWLRDEETQNRTKEILTTAYDEKVLSDACGRSKDVQFLEMDIREVIEANELAERIADASSPDDPVEIAPALVESLADVSPETLPSTESVSLPENGDSLTVEEPTLYPVNEDGSPAPEAGTANDTTSPFDINALLDQIGSK